MKKWNNTMGATFVEEVIVDDFTATTEDQLVDLDQSAVERILTATNSYEELLVVLEEKAEDLGSFIPEMGEDQRASNNKIVQLGRRIMETLSDTLVAQLVKTVAAAVLGVIKFGGKVISFTAISIYKLIAGNNTARDEFGMYIEALKDAYNAIPEFRSVRK